MLRKPVGERIRYARLRVGMTQQQLADAIGTDRLHVLKWEAGRYGPIYRYRVALAAALDFPLEFFRHEGRGGKRT